MGAMYRITCKKLLILIRLVIVVSLAGYSLSNATAAMHGDALNAPTVASETMEHTDAHIGEHDHHGQVSTDDDASKVVDQDCCNDFCISFAIVATVDTLDGPVVSSTHMLIDDQRSFGEIPTLHRPPNI
jgi:hypothetical protein